MSDAPIKTLWDNDRAMREIESLRQQLSAVQAELEAERNRRFEGNRISSQEYNDSQKREVMLRNAIHDGCLCIAQYGEQPPDCLIEALAATADLDGLILCENDPVGYKHETAEGLYCLNTFPPSGQIGWITIPLYRAWEPKP